jgi:lipid II:glycine glycyltransferase (peptidoglycan interpeptide bridge formation enzyme)
MHEWIRQDLAILCRASLDGRLVGAALISVFKDGAYYSSSCEDPEYNHLPIGHILQWEAMRWLKEHGARRYEIGLQVYGSQEHMTVSEKETRIAFFKRGFGGVTVPFWRGEKFYSRDYCLRVATKRAQQYADTIETASARSGLAE